MAIRVIHMAPLGTGGITNLTINIHKHIDKSKVQFDYLVFRNRKEFAEDTIYSLGGQKKIVDLEQADNAISRFFVKMNGLITLFRKEKYDVVHVDASTPYDVFVALAARIAGIRVIIFHSHNDSYKKGNILKDIMMPVFKSMMKSCCTDYIAISEPAAQFMFPHSVLKKKQYVIFKNAIDAEKCAFDLQKRTDVRKQMEVDDDTFILGNVGRFVYQKNHEFMLNVFATLKKIRSNSKLLLVGEGVLEAELKQLAKSLKIEDSVIFYGVTHDVPAVLSAMDAFIFPSRFEGFGIVAIEAQVSGLPVWCSTAIPQMAKICDEFKYIDSDSCDKWAEVISEYHDHYQRMPHIDNARKAGYDITSLSADMQEYYEHRVCKM